MKCKYQSAGKYVLILMVFCVALFLLLWNRSLDLKVVLGGTLLSAAYCGVFFYSVQRILRTDNKTVRYILLFCALWTVMLFYVSLLHPVILWDTWQVYDMSKYVFSDFGYMDQIRQHIAFTHYEMAFPPVMPVGIAVINLVFDMGVSACVYFNSIVLMLLVAAFSKLFQSELYQLSGAIVLLFTMLGLSFISIYLGGLTQILGFYLLVLIIMMLMQSKLTLKDCAVLGVLCGLNLMNRFDALAVAAVVLLMVPIVVYVNQKSMQKSVQSFAVYGSSLLVTCFPWMIYSVVHFSSIFVTDNGRRLFNIIDTRPSTFFSASNPALTIKDDFSGWANAFTGRVWTAIKACILATLKSTLLPIIILAVIALMVVVIIKKVKIKNYYQLIKKKCNVRLVAVLLVILGQEALFLLTGYSDQRYHIPFLVFMQIQFVWLLLDIGKNVKEILPGKGILVRYKKVGITAVCLCAFVVLCFALTPVNAIQKILQGENYSSTLELNSEEDALRSYLVEGECANLCIYRSEQSFDFLKFSALSGITNMISPSNLSDENVEAFVNTFKINYLYSSNEDVVDCFSEKLSLKETEIEYLYRIVNP